MPAKWECGEGFSPYTSHVMGGRGEGQSMRTHNRSQLGFIPPSLLFMWNRVYDKAHKFILLFYDWRRWIKQSFSFFRRNNTWFYIIPLISRLSHVWKSHPWYRNKSQEKQVFKHGSYRAFLIHSLIVGKMKSSIQPGRETALLLPWYTCLLWLVWKVQLQPLIG